MSENYDVIVVGARCAGAPTAMLLARQGHRVLLVDRATFPSDTVSTHLLHPPGVAALARWGLLDRLVATGCPPIDPVRARLRPADRARRDPGGVAYGPRRTVLDALLVDAAAEAGVEVRPGFGVDEVLIEDGRVAGIRGPRGSAAGPRGRRRGRAALAGRPLGPAGDLPREAAAAGRLLRLLERASDGRPVRDVQSGRTAGSPRSPPTTG